MEGFNLNALDYAWADIDMAAIAVFHTLIRIKCCGKRNKYVATNIPTDKTLQPISKWRGQ